MQNPQLHVQESSSLTAFHLVCAHLIENVFKGATKAGVS